jgi:hypothetical protein
MELPQGALRPGERVAAALAPHARLLPRTHLGLLLAMALVGLVTVLAAWAGGGLGVGLVVASLAAGAGGLAALAARGPRLALTDRGRVVVVQGDEALLFDAPPVEAWRAGLSGGGERATIDLGELEVLVLPCESAGAPRSERRRVVLAGLPYPVTLLDLLGARAPR